MKALTLILTIAVGLILLVAVVDLPDWGDPNSPASTYLSPHFIENSMVETGAPNMVTAVLANYRSYDTMFEVVVVFCAALTILFVLRRTHRKTEKFHKPRPAREDSDIILQWAARLLVPAMQIFALYVLVHGHHSPGGGFQGGVIFGAGFILLALAYDLETILKPFREGRLFMFCVLGAALYVGIGIGSLLLGGNFMDYGVWADILGVSEVKAHYLGMLGIEIGVTITVMAVMFSMYADLASGGDMDEGL
jgi:multicomponent Na+:H+ antiporter subunit B